MMAMMVSETGGLAIGQTALMGQKWLVSADSQEFNLEDEVEPPGIPGWENLP